MGIRVALNHTTTYRYDRPVQLSPQVVRLRPAPHTRTPILSYSLRIQPQPHFLNWQQDPYSNYHARLVFPKPTREFQVVVDLVAEMTPINPFDFFLEESAQEFPFQYEEAIRKELTPYLETLPDLGAEFQAFVASQRQPAQRTIDFIVALNRAIQERVDYVIRLEPGVQTPDETLACGRGSCRDSAWLLVQVCRHLGLAARFCSGYLIQLTFDEKPLPLEGEPPASDGPATDFTDLHAWVEVYLPGAGWVGLDPTSGLLAGEGHIPLACTADPQNAAAISGGFTFEADPLRPEEPADVDFQFHMAVTRIHETPRVTKPYTPQQWWSIDTLGQRVDQWLRAQDVRLTMGGEPTFVSIDHRDADEWNTTALGPHKRLAAMVLVKRLRDAFAGPGGFLHFGQGKWYPGESLPRWAFGCYWRKDGEPIWRNPSLVADEAKPRGYTAADAERFIHRLTEVLELPADTIMPGYEDAWYYLWRERRLPTNVDPLDNRLEDPEERARLARVFEQGLKQIVGYALPLRRSWGGLNRWETGRWFLRKEHLFLIPGDSPMGFRLPLDSILWEPDGTKQNTWERDPFAPRGPLPRSLVWQQPGERPHAGSEGSLQNLGPSTALLGASRSPNGPLPQADSFPGWSRNSHAATAGAPSVHPQDRPADRNDPIVRTALTAEARQGTLYIFMPPLPYIEDYLELVAAVEATAYQLQMPVLVEGYPPPYDPRIQKLAVTPDPGVLEVNMHPVESWSEAVFNTKTLYEEARLSRLSTEKFQLDGRHTGTGGGNHVVLGGATPGDSPFLRRPDLLRSLVTIWNNHPSLSYLFSGLFVGPTSQHPRVDEARHDSLYELEIAFQQVDRRLPTPPAWLVDRWFRNLLIDATGNTHRTELCIDKLYSPDSASGRLGLLELRSFEMPPHAEMSCVQQLLLRALIAWFWRQPYQQPLVRWGTELHDRFMLPHFVEQDFQDLLGELKQAGFPFDPAWFAPHLEFRFPRIGELVQRGIQLELRTAIEPWHVLGEEVVVGGTARYVDSSLERLQVKVRGWTEPRHILTCNGARVPLVPTGTVGEYVAGVRYRAWQPPHCLHPTIGVHAPLVFDLLDLWNDRSVGGCTYFVSHPGGRAHETMPVNGREAEGRRLARYYAFGHTPGPVSVPPHATNPHFPMTLDLRATGPWPKDPQRPEPAAQGLEGDERELDSRRIESNPEAVWTNRSRSVLN